MSPILIDAHIHLFRDSDLPNFRWQHPDGPLYKSHDLPDYIAAISPIPPYYGGFVFVETDRKWTNPASPTTADELVAWKHVLEEYRYVLQTATSPGRPAAERNLVRGIVPWAPIHQGRDAMVRYQNLLDAIDLEVGYTSASGDGKNELLVGYRYLLQGEPPGVATAPTFIEGLEFIRDSGRVFEIGVDVNRYGLWQLKEMIETLRKVPGLKAVFNHLGKPPLGREPEGGMARWEELIAELATLPDVVVKLSGGFSELPEDFKDSDPEFPRSSKVTEMVMKYARPIVKLFGPRRIIWASDWPICGLGHEKAVGLQAGAWKAWLAISRILIGELMEEGEIEATKEEWDGIWGANTVRVYSLVERRT